MFTLTYMSTAVRRFSREELLDLLQRSRTRNEADGLSGMLLYRDGAFMQTIEGPREAVLATKARIDRDPRHEGVVTLISQETPAREFDGWSMAFRDISGLSIEEPGYHEFMNAPITTARLRDVSDAARRMLLRFKQWT